MTVSSDSICQTYQNVRCDTRDRQWPNSLRDHTKDFKFNYKKCRSGPMVL